MSIPNVDTDAAFRAADTHLNVQKDVMRRMREAAGARRIIAGPNETDTEPDENGVMHMQAPFTFTGTWQGEASGARVLLEGDPGGPRTWTNSEIDAMSDAEFEENQEAINKAMSEGRITDDR